MADPQTWAISYFAARGNVPWRWADDGNVIVWSDGTTICFREEIIYILEWLAPRGWPCFGSLVWVLAACRGKLPPPLVILDEEELSSRGEEEGQRMLGDILDRLRDVYASVENGLAEISRLPAEAHSSLKAKAVLAEVVFVKLANGAAERALTDGVLEALRSGALTDDMLNDPGAPALNEQREWKALHGCFSQVTPESLALRLRTGLDVLPKPAKLPAAPADRMRKLLAELRKDPEHAGLARLTRDFMAALQLPRRLTERDELPLGGVADIANRGSLDRLLLSELAHDDLTLAVRVALGEALYLRREPPAKHPPSTLALLVDSGVRLWGIPRVLATSAAMALIANSSEHEEVSVFRARGETIEPVNLLEKEGLTAHLGVLEPHAHPGLALAAFREYSSKTARPEAVLVTQRDAYRDADFQRNLAQAKFDALYVGLVDRDGSFELFQYPNGALPLCRAHVDLEALFPKPAAKEGDALIDLNQPDLPLSLSMRPFPLLLAVKGPVRMAASTADGGGICLLSDRRLLKWTASNRGASTIAFGLPRGIAIHLSERLDKTICVATLVRGRRRVACSIYSPDGKLLHGHDWPFDFIVRSAERKGDVLFIIGGRNAAAMDLHEGRQLGSIAFASVDSHGRYFRGVDGLWKLLTWNGQQLAHEPVTFPRAIGPHEAMLVFNRQGFEGPWALLYNGEIRSHKGETVMKLGQLGAVRRVSIDGHRLLVCQAADQKVIRVDLKLLRIMPEAGYVDETYWKSEPSPPVYEVQTHFDRIGFHPPCHVYLHSPKSGWHVITPEGLQLTRHRMRKEEPGNLQSIAFRLMNAKLNEGYTLRIARWIDGRRAWLDSRGMLHLRSSEPEVPEITIAIGTNSLAAWCSAGEWVGSPFFRGDHGETLSSRMWAALHSLCQPIA